MRSLKEKSLSASDVEEIAKLAKGAYTRDAIKGSTTKDPSWDVEVLFHDGDLKVSDTRSIFDRARHYVILVVHGNLTVEGLFQERYCEPECITVVTGNLTAKNVITAGFLEVQGDLVVQESLVGDYNDCSAQIFGTMRARFIYPASHSFKVHGEVNAEYARELKPTNAAAVILTSDLQLRALLDDPLLKIEQDEDDWSIQCIDHAALKARLVAGKPIFRSDFVTIGKTPSDAARVLLRRELLSPGEVTRIAFTRKALTEVPEVVFEFPNLEELFLDFNAIPSLPGRIGDLTRLKTLSLDSNPMTELVPQLARLACLESLSLRYVKLANLPAWFAELSNLRELWLTFDARPGFLAPLAQLKRLESLNFTRCVGIDDATMRARVLEIERLLPGGCTIDFEQ